MKHNFTYIPPQPAPKGKTEKERNQPMTTMMYFHNIHHVEGKAPVTNYETNRLLSWCTQMITDRQYERIWRIFNVD